MGSTVGVTPPASSVVIRWNPSILVTGCTQILWDNSACKLTMCAYWHLIRAWIDLCHECNDVAHRPFAMAQKLVWWLTRHMVWLTFCTVQQSVESTTFKSLQQVSKGLCAHHTRLTKVARSKKPCTDSLACHEDIIHIVDAWDASLRSFNQSCKGKFLWRVEKYRGGCLSVP